jgi:hypothetical protein
MLPGYNNRNGFFLDERHKKRQCSPSTLRVRFFGGVLSALAWYWKKIETILRNMKTDLGRMMAMERLPYGEDFLQRFEAENSGLIENKKTI